MEAAVIGTADAWRERITAQRVSGQSIRGWCRENALREHAFYWWRCRLGLSPGPARKRRGRREPFTELIVDAPGKTGFPGIIEPMVLRLAGGRELVLPASMPVDRVAGLVRAIEALS